MGSLFFLLMFRRDSFITHRAFCDALADESARSQKMAPLRVDEGAGNSSVLDMNENNSFTVADTAPPPLSAVVSPGLSIQSSGEVCSFYTCKIVKPASSNLQFLSILNPVLSLS